MKPLWLRVRAPFAAFRWMQAGVYRATSPVIPPSAAWGLLLNLAGVETREEATPTTLVRGDAPPLRIAVAMLETPEQATLYQQLHTYPVGTSGEEGLKPRTHGAKYWIAPARREILVGFDCQLGVMAEDGALLAQIVDGLSGLRNGSRYGLPFAGDNNFLIDRIDVLGDPLPARWYEAMGPDEGPRRGSCRLTVGIDRADASRTSTLLFAPTRPLPRPPDAAWTWTPRAPAKA
jgi:CRISPR-associated protein Cas5t